MIDTSLKLAAACPFPQTYSPNFRDEPYVQYLDTRKKHEARPGGDLFGGLPIAVLVQKQMSSGNVFLTAALQDHGRAIVVGEPTSGEAYVRQYVQIPGRDIKIVFATGLLQRGDGTTLLSKPSHTIRRVELDGRVNKTKRRPGFIMPDHVVSNYTPRPGIGSHLTHPRSDAILAKAIEVLRKAAAAKSSTKDAAG